MRAILYLAAFATLVASTSTCNAALTVVFEGALSHFDTGYEAILSPGERVQGKFTIPSPGERYAHEFLGAASSSHLVSQFSIVGDSGWDVVLNEGVVTRYSGSLQPGGPNSFIPGYRYSALGGAVTMPTQGSTHSGGPFDRTDFPDIAILPTFVPTVWNPTIEFTIAGPALLWDHYGESPLPPPLSEATIATIKLNLEVFVPMVGIQRRTATFSVAQVSVVPEPAAWIMGASAVVIAAMLRRKP